MAPTDPNPASERDASRRLRDVLRQLEDPIAFLTGIFEHSPVALQVYRADGHSLLTNPAFRALFGSEPPSEYNVLEDEIARDNGVLGLVRRAFVGETVRTPPIWYDPRELTQVSVSEGNRVIIEPTFFPLRGRDDRVEHVAVVFKDITAERSLREQAERERDLLGLIIEQSGDGIVVVDASGTVRVFNSEAQRQHGVSLRPVPPERWAESYGLRDMAGRPLPLEATPLYRALHGEKVEHARWMVERPDGSTRILTGTASPLRAKDGASSGAVLVTRDDTTRIEHERQLAFQATVLSNVRDSIIVTDSAGHIVQWNEGAERVFGYRAEEMLGRTPAVLYDDPGSAPLGGDLAVIGEGQDFVGEWKGRRKDGSAVWVEMKTTHLRDAAGAAIGFIGVGNDVTDRKMAELARAQSDRAREEALEMAEAANHSKDEFLAMLGHELRNPLSPIVTALQLMKLKGDVASSKEQEVIERQVGHLVRLVDDLLDVSRITRGKVELKKAPIEMHEVVAKAVEMASPLFEKQRHHLSIKVPSSGLRMEGDPARLAQVVSNLLTNAAKYTEAGGHVAIRSWREGDEIVLSVTDDGVGIAPELLPRVFDLFVQGPRSAARSEGGLGIGLTLVRNLVSLHGGTVVARSGGRGAGSEFVVRLPALTAEPSCESLPTEEAHPLVVPRRRRILVVDDNEDAATGVAEVLRAAGHEVAVAHDGAGALGSVAGFHPEVAILDIGLPVMDGYELARRLREVLGQPAPHLIALTGYGQERDVARSLEAGFEDHLVKPIAPNRLLRRIASLP